MKWIRNQKAIDTLVALDGIRPGDEIIYTAPRDCRGVHNLRLGWVYIVQDTDDGRIGGEGNWWGKPEKVLGIIADKDGENDHYFTRTNIKAWRRPK